MFLAPPDPTKMRCPCGLCKKPTREHLCTVARNTGRSTWNVLLDRHICKDCRKKARNVLKEYTTPEEFLEHKCDHVEQYNYLTAVRSLWRGVDKRFRMEYDEWFGGSWNPQSGCALCRDEMRKETSLRRKKRRKTDINKQLAIESLQDKCCRIIVREPALVLIATTHDPPVPEMLWEKMYEAVPRVLTKEFNEDLDESEKANDAKWMYRTVGELFARYIRRRKGRYW